LLILNLAWLWLTSLLAWPPWKSR